MKEHTCSNPSFFSGQCSDVVCSVGESLWPLHKELPPGSRNASQGSLGDTGQHSPQRNLWPALSGIRCLEPQISEEVMALGRCRDGGNSDVTPACWSYVSHPLPGVGGHSQPAALAWAAWPQTLGTGNWEELLWWFCFEGSCSGCCGCSTRWDQETQGEESTLLPGSL